MLINKIYIIIAAGVLVLFLFANALQFVLWGEKVKSIEADYTENVNALEERIAGIGEIVQAWTVVRKTEPGQVISREDLKPVQTLKNSMGEAYVTNLQEIEGKIYKVSVLPGTPITKDVIMEEKILDSTRQMEVASNILPVGLKAGDYIDYRFVMPKGEDYIAMTHKRVEGVHGKIVTLNMTEEEIHIYESLLIDYFLREGSFIYMTKYLEPGFQEPAKTYYPVSENILEIMTIDPNIVEKIEASIINEKRSVLSAGDKGVTEEVIGKISGGRTNIESKIDSANSMYWDDVEKAGNGADTQDGENTGEIQTEQPAADTNQNPEQPADTPPPLEPPVNLPQQDTGVSDDAGLNIQKEVVQ